MSGPRVVEPAPGSSPGAEAGLYVHVPFCARACPYCDFDFEVNRTPPVDAYFAALDAEVAARRHGPAPSWPETFGTIYIGGGTPSVLGPAGISRLGHWLAGLASSPSLASSGWGHEERTVELNPEHVDDAMVSAVREAGFDRVSLGVQSFEAAGLAELGRVHTAEAARAAVRRLTGAGLRVSVDLIVGWRGQNGAALRRDLEVVETLAIHHLSIYALTIESGTPWTRLVRRGLRVMPDDELGARMLLEAEALLEGRGWVHYEVASYGRGGDRARHNARYWGWVDYVGLGPSAASARYHGDGSVERRSNLRGFAAWCAAPGAGGEVERLAPEAAAREGLWVGLRRLDGLDLEAFSRRFPRPPGWLNAALAPLVRSGDLELLGPAAGGRRVRVAPGRWLWHDDIAARILAG